MHLHSFHVNDSNSSSSSITTSTAAGHSRSALSLAVGASERRKAVPSSRGRNKHGSHGDSHISKLKFGVLLWEQLPGADISGAADAAAAAAAGSTHHTEDVLMQWPVWMSSGQQQPSQVTKACQ
jgi:hypothetical protein